jgi:hypothetical protein
MATTPAGTGAGPKQSLLPERIPRYGAIVAGVSTGGAVIRSKIHSDSRAPSPRWIVQLIRGPHDGCKGRRASVR